MPETGKTTNTAAFFPAFIADPSENPAASAVKTDNPVMKFRRR